MHFKGVTSIYVSFIILPLIAIFTSCTAETKEVEILNEKNQVIEKYSIDPVTKYKEGEYIRFYPSGQKAEETYYYNDTINGERKFYFESGQLDRVQHYLYGVFQGEFKSYYSNGNLSAEGNYLNNEMDGIWKRYYESGELMEEVTFVDNEENGPFKEYFKNGKLNTEGSYINGPFEHNELKEYNEKGELIRKMNCERGVCTTSWIKK